MNKIVPPSGSLNSKIAFIGQAPGREEDAKLKPFIGPSGFVLNQNLVRVGINRAECYLDNVIPHKVDNIKKYFSPNKQGFYTVSPEAQQYIDELMERLSKVKANVFVPLGNEALYALLSINPPKIGARHGSLYLCDKLNNAKVIPTYHPANIVRGTDFLIQPQFLFDLQRIAYESRHPEDRNKYPNLILEPTYEQSLQYLRRCFNTDYVAMDIEGTHHINCISFAYENASAICIPFTNGKENYFSNEQEANLWIIIAQIMENAKIEKVGQNINYDTKTLFRLYGICSRNLHDTMIAEGIIRPDYRKALEHICQRYTNIPYYKDEGHESFKTGVILDIRRFWHYSALDSHVPFIAFPKQKKRLREQGNWASYSMQVKGVEVANFMQARALKVDKEGILTAGEALSKEYDTLLSAFRSKLGLIKVPRKQKGIQFFEEVEFSPTATIHKQTLFYSMLKYAEITQNKKVTVNEKALLKLIGKGCTEAKEVLAMTKIQTQITRYFRLYNAKEQTYLLDPRDQRLRCSFNLSLKTARWSSSKWFPKGVVNNFGLNLQTLPKKSANPKYPFRRYVTSDVGFMFGRVDLNSAENRIMAYICPDKGMQRAFEEGRDLYKDTYSEMYGIPLNEVTPSQRKDGKDTTLALGYGMSPYTFHLNQNILLKKARDLFTRFHHARPGIKRYHNWVLHVLKKEGRTLYNCLGRKYIYRDRITEAGEQGKNLFSWIPSSTVADIINGRGLNYIYYDNFLFEPLQLLLQWHDEFDFQFPVITSYDHLFEMFETIRLNLEKPLRWNNKEFVIPAEFSFGFNLWDMEEIDFNNWSQGAMVAAIERVKDERAKEISTSHSGV